MGRPDVVPTKQAELMACFQYLPRDAESSTEEQLIANRALLNSAIRRLSSGWAVWFEHQHFETTYYDESEWPDPVSRMIDDQRRELFTTPGKQFADEFFISLLHAPPKDAEGRIAASFESDDGADDDKRLRDAFEKIDEEAATVLGDLRSFMMSMKRLRGDDLVTYLHNCISPYRQRVRMPQLPVFIGEYLTDTAFVPGLSPAFEGLDKHHIRIVRIKDEPDSTSPEVLDALKNLPFPYRRVSRWLPFSPADARAELEKRRNDLASSRKGLMQRLMQQYLKADDGTKDNTAAEAAMFNAIAALELLAKGDVSYGYWSHVVIVWNQKIDVAAERARNIEQLIRARNFITATAQDDSMSCWLGSIPGHPQGDLGRLLISSLTFSDVLPATSVWSGPDRDEHLNGPPLIRGLSHGGTAFRLCLHQPKSDVGHFAFTADTGAGKTTALGSIVAGHRRYSKSREVLFDRGGGLKGITLALGGSHYAFDGGENSVSLQPLAFIDDPKELAWAFEWICGCCRQQKEPVSAEQKDEIAVALNLLSTRPQNMRTLTGFKAIVQDYGIKRAIGTFCLGGGYGDLLDSDSYAVGNAPIRCYEMDSLLYDRTEALAPVISCLLRDIVRNFDGCPTLVSIDECKTLIQHELTAAAIGELIRRGRKEMLHVGLITQSMSDIADSELSQVIMQSTKLWLFGQNSDTDSPKSSQMFTDIGLSAKQRQIIAQLAPKREYVAYAPGNGWRKFELNLSELELMFVGRGSAQDRREMDRIINSYPRDEYVNRWISYCNSGKYMQLAAE